MNESVEMRTGQNISKEKAKKGQEQLKVEGEKYGLGVGKVA